MADGDLSLLAETVQRLVPVPGNAKHASGAVPQSFEPHVSCLLAQLDMVFHLVPFVSLDFRNPGMANCRMIGHRC